MKRFLLEGLAPTIVLVVALATPAQAQKTLFTFAGDAAGDHLGSALAGAGDVDGDGFDDLLIGAPDADIFGADSGRAKVLSGQTGQLLHTLVGAAAGDRLGSALSGTGDVDADGFDDFIIGAPGADPGGIDSGQAIVYSGLTGQPLYTYAGSVGIQLGSAVGGGGDVNGDGFDDFIIGAPGADATGTNAGFAVVYSGQTGGVLRILFGTSPGDTLGTAVALVPDVDGDGFDDILAGASGDDNNGANSGSARLISGQTGAVLHAIDGTAAGALFGIALAGTGDVDGDGFGDFIVGAPGTGNNGTFSGNATVFSGRTGAVLYSVDGDGAGFFFGSSVAGLGDVDGDGFADFGAGSSLENVAGKKDVGVVRLFSGQGGALIYRLTGDSKNDQFGFSMASAGDVNADGRSDVVLGAPGDDGAALDDGSAIVIAGQPFIGVNYCGPAVLNSSGLPAVIQALGSAVAADGELTLRAMQVPTTKFGFFVVSATQGFNPGAGGSQGNLCVAGNIGRFAKQIQNSGLSGSLSIDVDTTALPLSPPTPIQPGDTYNFQAWFRDKNPNLSDSNFTDGIQITFL